MLRLDDAGEQQLPGIRGPHATRPLCTVESERIGVELRTPKGGLKSRSQLFGLAFKIGGLVLPTESPCGPRGEQFGRIDISLHFSESDWSLGKPAIFMKDRIQRILPALIGEAFLRHAVIFGKAVLIDIRRPIDP